MGKTFRKSPSDNKGAKYKRANYKYTVEDFKLAQEKERQNERIRFRKYDSC